MKTSDTFRFESQLRGNIITQQVIAHQRSRVSIIMSRITV